MMCEVLLDFKLRSLEGESPFSKDFLKTFRRRNQCVLKVVLVFMVISCLGQVLKRNT